MSTRRSFSPTGQRLDSGLMVPSGRVSDLTASSNITYLGIKEKATDLRKLFESSTVPLPPTSDLAKLAQDAADLSDAWLSGKGDQIPEMLLYRASQFDHIA